eukprot:TRINITY_DN15288_c0_g1_i6.p1 TRINITY_DN15288_c0_g1~~TRINITY_DN15288_c0_g1_i6.p1  ORF type:complete len:538 (-),score=265.31 TRINITY_DN15288_c0_g1_i6:111-1724(-)
MELPQAIKDMDQEETVCSVCGVSYLVFREIKALEKRIRSLEADLRDKDEVVHNAKTALEAATSAKSDADAIIANINSKSELKLQSLRDEQAAAIREACVEAQAEQRHLLEAAETRVRLECERGEAVQGKAQGLGRVCAALRAELINQRGLTSNELKACKAEAQETIQQILTAVTAQDASLAQSLRQVAALEQSLKQAQQEQHSTEMKLAERASELQLSVTREQELGGELCKAQAKAQECASLAEHSEQALEEQHKQHTQAAQQHKQQHKAAQQEQAALQAQLQEQQVAATALLARTQEAEAALKAAQQAAEAQARGLSDASKHSGELQSDNKRLGQELKHAQGQVEHGREECARVKHQCESLQAQLTQASAAAQVHQTSLTESESECTRLSQLVSALERELGVVKSGQESSNMKLTDLCERQKLQIAALDKGVTQGKQQLEDALSAQGSTAAQLRALEKQQQERQQQEQRQSATLGELRTQHTALSQQLAKSSTQQYAELASRDTVINGLREQLAASEEQRAKSQAQAASQGEQVWS